MGGYFMRELFSTKHSNDLYTQKEPHHNQSHLKPFRGGFTKTSIITYSIPQIPFATQKNGWSHENRGILNPKNLGELARRWVMEGLLSTKYSKKS